MKKYYPLLSLPVIVLLSACIYYAYNNAHTSNTHTTAYTVHMASPAHKNVRAQNISEKKSDRKDEIEQNKDGEENETDGMMQAMAQEVELTKDPALGYVPRSRLWTAIQYTQKLSNSRSAISGITWTERGPNDVGGRTRAIMVDPNDPTHKTVWAAGVGGGLWKTTNITATNPNWNYINDFFANLAITTIAYDSINTGTMYFGTGEGWFNLDAIQGNGIFKSTDSGKVWTQLSSTTNSSFEYIQKIIVHPVTHDVYAATRSGLYRSQNGGTSWSQVLTGAAADIEIGADHSLYAAIGVFSAGSIWKSTTGNSGSWTQLNTNASGFPTSGFDRVALACAPSNSQVVYAMTQSSSNDGLNGIYKSTNGGTTWSMLTMPSDADGGIGSDITRGQAWYDLIIAVDPNNANTAIIGGVDLFKTTDGGNTWNQISHWYGGFGYQYVHADQHAIVFQKGSSTNVYFGNDGGIWQSTDGGNTINSEDSTYNVTQYYACALNPNKGSNEMLAGAQDNGTERLSVAGIGYGNQVVGGDGAFCHIDQLNPANQYASYVYSNFYVSSDSGYTFNQVISDNTGPFVNPSALDSKNQVLYSGYSGGQYLYWANPQSSSTDAKNTVSAFNGGTVTAVTVSDTINNRVYFGLNNARVVYVDKANTSSPTATNISTGLPTSGSVSCIAIQPGNSKHILVTYSNYGVNSVWETKNGGTSWTSVEGNLPDMPVRWALFVPNRSTRALLATEVGVWSTDSLQGTSTVWGASNTGLANVSTYMLQWRSSDNVIIAATHGRGVFSTNYFSKPQAAFTANVFTLCDTGTVSFTNNTVNGVSYNWAFGDGTKSTTVSPVHKYTTCGNYTVRLIATSNAGYNDTLTQTSYVNVKCLASKPIASAGKYTSVCAGDSTAIGAANVSGITYNWSPSKSLSSATVSNPFALPSASTLYTLTAIGSSNCSIDTVTVHVNPIVVPAITITPSIKTAICAGTPVKFIATPSNGGTAPVYQWKRNGVVVGADSSNYTFNNFNNHDIITLVLTSNALCPAPSSVTSKGDTLKVNALPVPVVASMQTICAGSKVNIGGSSVANLKYNWQSNTSLSSDSVSNPVASPTITTTYVLTATDTTTHCYKTDSVSVKVNQKITPTVSLKANASIPVCAGTPITFTAKPINGGTPIYSWEKNKQNTNKTDSIYKDSIPANGDIISVRLISSLACVTNDTALSQNDTIKVNPLPLANAGVDTTICAGAHTTIGSNTVTGIKYTWLPLTNLSSDTISNPVASPTLSTTYTLTATSTATQCSNKGTMVLTVNPHITIGAIAGSVSASVGFTNKYSVSNHAGNIFHWIVSGNGTIKSGQGTDTLAVTWNTKGSATIKVWTECSDTTTITINITTGVYDIANSNTTLIYPNPTGSKATIEFNTTEDNAEVIVTDALGRLLMSHAVTPTLNHHYKTDVDLTGIAAGLYFVQIKTTQQSVVRRLVKE